MYFAQDALCPRRFAQFLSEVLKEEHSLLLRWSITYLQDLSFGGFHRDDIGRDIFGDSGLNGIELGPVVELTSGWKPGDRLAMYVGGSGSDTLIFLYTVQEVFTYSP